MSVLTTAKAIEYNLDLYESVLPVITIGLLAPSKSPTGVEFAKKVVAL